MINYLKSKLAIVMVAVIAVCGLAVNFAVNAYSQPGANYVIENVEVLNIDGGGQLGGLVVPYTQDFPEGISVDGTTVIDGSGNWDGAVTGTTGTFSSTLGVTGATTLSSTLGVTGATTLSSTLGVTGAISGSDYITSDITTDIGWTINSGANTACTTTCTTGAVFGFDTGTSVMVGPADATADTCMCAGAN